MLTVTPVFLETLRASHAYAFSATVYPPNASSFTVDIEDGSVVNDRTAANRRQLDLTISDPSLYPTQPTDPLGVWGTEVQVWLGVEYGDGTRETVSQGVYRVQDAEVDMPAGSLPITGWDRSKQVQDQRFIQPRKFLATDGVALITQLLQEVFPGAVVDSRGVSVSETIAKHTVQQDRWAEITRIAALLGCEVFADANGDWVIQDVPDPSSTSPVWTVNAGSGGVLVSAGKKVTRDGAPNGVVVSGQSANGNQDPVWAVAKDLDPLSPTLWGGPFGKVPFFVTSGHVKTTAQATRVAKAQLANHLGVSRTVSFTSVPNPALEAGDLITITYEDGSSENHVIDVLTIGLSPAGQMTGETRVVSWNAS